ncbi:hypothetical protein VD659_00925 [Herbiconiux sp. 11R-BC]|uniref:hypothetical protein n=1 Tax=Herbiconiux sp. 11R-BC TaxID=3111637 RepID=UPI003BFC0B6C
MTTASGATAKPAKPAKTDPATGSPKRGFRTYGRSGWAVALVFAFLYAYHLWGGVANLLGVVSSFSSFGVDVTGGIWALLIAYAAVPLLVYVAALLVGRTLSTGARIVVFAVGFAVVSVISQDLLTLS